MRQLSIVSTVWQQCNGLYSQNMFGIALTSKCKSKKEENWKSSSQQAFHYAIITNEHPCKDSPKFILLRWKSNKKICWFIHLSFETTSNSCSMNFGINHGRKICQCVNVGTEKHTNIFNQGNFLKNFVISELWSIWPRNNTMSSCNIISFKTQNTKFGAKSTIHLDAGSKSVRK